MNINACKSVTLHLIALLLLNNTLFSETKIEQYDTSGPLQLMFKDQHEQEQLTPCQALNRKAVAAMSSQDWQKVFGYLMEAMKKDPASPETYINFGVAHTMREEYPSSEKALLKALEVDPENAKANFHYSQVMVLKGEKELAMEAAIKAVSQSEESEWKYLAWLGDLKIDESAYREAANSYEKARQVLKEKIETVNSAIQREESRQQIVETYTDIELVSDVGGGVREVEVQKFRYEQKDAPDEWHQLKENLETRLNDLQSRLDETLKLAGT